MQNPGFQNNRDIDSLDLKEKDSPAEQYESSLDGIEYYLPSYRSDKFTARKINGIHFINDIPVQAHDMNGPGKGANFLLQPSVDPIALSRETFLVLGFDNDVWVNTDYYYTNGIRIGLFHPDLRYSPFARLLLPDLRKAVNYYGLVLVHDMFTPIDPDKKEIQVGDRPFASTLYISHRKISILSGHGLRLSSSFDIGVIGGAALGGVVQQIIHEIDPNGWDNQVRNDAVLNYQVIIDKSLFRDRFAEAAVTGEAHLGTLRTGLSTGLSIRTGDFNSRFAALAQTFPGRGFFHGRLRYFIEAGAEVRIVGFDATLQGGLINNSSIYILDSPELKRIVYQAHAGFGIGLGRFSLEATQVILSPEFSGGKRHLWVGLSSTINL